MHHLSPPVTIQGSMLALWSLVTVVAVLEVKAENLGKPFITPYPEGRMKDDLEKHLPLHKWEITRWADGNLIPERCKFYAEDKKLKPVDMEVSDVKFDDCDEPWVFCRHKDALPLEEFVKAFAYLPVQGRSSVGHVVGLPGDTLGLAWNGDVVLSGNIHAGWLWHEASHLIDHWCDFPGQVDGDHRKLASDTQTWLDAHNADSHVSEEYSNTAQVENFAQTLVHTLYDVNVPGGLKGLGEDTGTTTDGKPNWELYQNKVRVQTQYCRAQVTANTNDRCVRKEKGSASVLKEKNKEEKHDVVTRDGLVDDDHVMEGYPGGRFNEDYAKHLPKHEAEIKSWQNERPDAIPRYCYDNVKGSDLDPNDVEVFDVTYDDCFAAWIMCRHKDAPWSIDRLAESFGRLPVRAREHVANVLLLPNPGGTYASTSGGGVLLKGDVDLGTLYHEVGHAVDANCPFPGKDGSPDSSRTRVWLDAFHKDGWVPDPQSNTGMPEDFTQVYLHALYDVNIPGGLPSIGTQTDGRNNWDLIKNQMDVQKQYCKAELTAGLGDHCEVKKHTTDIIRKDGSPLQASISRKRGPKRINTFTLF